MVNSGMSGLVVNIRILRLDLNNRMVEVVDCVV